MTTELIADFICANNNSWYFLKCKSYKMDYIPRKYSALFPMKTLTSNYFHKYDESLLKHSFEPFLTVGSLTSRLNSLGNKSKDFVKNNKFPIDFVTMKESNQIVYRSYASESMIKTVKSERNLDKLTSLYSTHINNIAENYDRIRNMAKNNKTELSKKENLPLNENFLNIVVKNILGRLEKNPELSRIPEIAGSFFAEFLEEGTKEHKNPEFFTKFQKNLD